MVESGGVGGPDPTPGPKPISSYESSGDRLRFTVDIRPGETTIVSWKKLLKEAPSSKPNGPCASISCRSSQAHQQQVSHPLPPEPAMTSSKQLAENEVKDAQAQAGPNRLSNVIEKIERIYAGNGSSEEEDIILDDVRDDDEYDTDDSFIDDTELDDYFQVDKSSIKHDGFFVNRGKLECIEHAATTNQKPKKRRHKDANKSQSWNNDVQKPNKLVKVESKDRKSIERNSISQLNEVTVPNMLTADVPSEASPLHAAESLAKRSADTQIAMNPSGLSSAEGFRQNKDAGQHRTRILTSQENKLKESSELQETSAQRSSDKNLHVSKSHSGKQLNNANELDQTIQQKEKVGIVGRFDLNAPLSASTSTEPQIKKVPAMPRKDGSNVRSRISMLEKAIRDLEKIVAECRPPSTEVQVPDNSSQTVKRRLPQDIKQKLAKVARLVQASYGKIPKDVTNRLMSIVGHLMQLRTLKRNLKIMANLGLTAKQEKDDRLQKIKEEVADMVRQRIPYMKSKLEHLNESAEDDFQGAGLQDKEALKQKYTMDDALENKICDLYDLYVDRLEEDSGPPVRRLYEELASMWPSGTMDTRGIKRAIYKTKDRRKLLANGRKDKENMRKRKVLAQKIHNGQAHTSNLSPGPAQKTHEEIPSDSQNHSSPLMGKPVSSPVLSNFPIMDNPKLENTKGSPIRDPLNAMPINVLPRKDAKRESNTDTGEARLDSEERLDQHKHVSMPVPKPNLESASS